MSEIIKKDEGIRRIFQQVVEERLIERARERGIFVYQEAVEQWVKKYLPLDELISLILLSPSEEHAIIREKFNNKLLKRGYPSLDVLLSHQREEKNGRGMRITRSVKTYSEDLILGVESWDEREKPEKEKEETIVEVFSPRTYATKPETISFTPVALELGKMEKENTFDSFNIWDEYWRSEQSKEYENLKPRLASLAVLRELAKELEGHVLDFGCGAFSPLLQALEKRTDIRVTAADSKNAIEKSRERFKSDYINYVILPKPAPYFWGFEKESFDCIVFSCVLHNINRISKAPVLLLSDYSLKSNGYMLIVEPREMEEDVKETEQYLGSMGYDVKIARKKVRWEERNPSYLYVLMARKREDMNEKKRNELLNRWMSLISCKDLRMKEMMKYSSLSGMSIEKIRAKIEELESINVFTLPPFIAKPDYTEIKKRVGSSVLEKVESEVGKTLEEIKKFIYNEDQQWRIMFPIEEAYREPLFDLVLRMLKKELEPNDFKEVVERYKLRVEGKKKRKGLTAADILKDYFDKLNERFLNKLFVDVEGNRVRFTDVRWKLKRVEEEVNRLSEEEYRKALQDWEKAYRLNVYI